MTMQRVIFENGHCLLPEQSNLDDYRSYLDDDVRAIAGNVIGINGTGIDMDIHAHRDTGSDMSLRMENICGGFRGSFQNVAGAGSLIQPGALRVGRFVRHRRFVGTHHLFHTIHGRLTYRVNKQMWGFKGCRSLPDLVKFVRDLTEDTESIINPVVNMLSVTLRTETALVIDPAHSLMQRVLERLYSNIVKVQSRMDDTNNLFFMDVISWKQLVKLVETDKARGVENVLDVDIHHVRSYVDTKDPKEHPLVSIGYTRNGVFFLRITFPTGCVCHVEGSSGVVQGVSTTMPSTVCVGGIEPFVNVVVRFIFLILVKMRCI
jgi:hypothetical protein